MKKRVLILIIVIMGALGCNNEKIAKFEDVDIQQFEQLMKETNLEQFVDVRTPEEFAKYKIKGAININFRDSLFNEKISKLDKEKPVLIYCLSGARSHSSLENFKAMGFKEVYNLLGGINGWSGAGKEIEEDLLGEEEITVVQFEKDIKENNLVLVDFYAPWCGPCKTIMPIVDEINTKYGDKVKVIKVNIDENRAFAKEKNLRSVPFFEIYKNGERIWSKAGGDVTKEEFYENLGL